MLCTVSQPPRLCGFGNVETAYCAHSPVQNVFAIAVQVHESVQVNSPTPIRRISAALGVALGERNTL
ncbi:hypothetical protein VTO73DRAFT_4037 [Trametes versicolor]